MLICSKSKQTKISNSLISMHFLKLQTTVQIKIKQEALSGVLEVNPFEMKPYELVSKLENLHQ